MKVIEAIESFFVRMVFPALKLVCRLVLLALVGILVLGALWVCFKIGADYGPATAELVERQLWAELAEWRTKIAQGSLLAALGGVLAVLELGAWWDGLKQSLNGFRSYGSDFLTKGKSLGDCMLSLWKSGRALLVPAVLSGSVASVADPPAPMPPPPIVERVLVPVSHHLHFENAAFEKGRLSDRGVTLGSARKASVKRILEDLKKCADPENGPVTVKPYGFASDDEFRGSKPRENETRNLRAANERAQAVYDILQDLQKPPKDFEWIKVEDPHQWHVPKEWDHSSESAEMTKMTKERACRIPVLEGKKRDSFADRAAVLVLTNPGKCEVAQVEAKEDQCDGAK